MNLRMGHFEGVDRARLLDFGQAMAVRVARVGVGTG